MCKAFIGQFGLFAIIVILCLPKIQRSVKVHRVHNNPRDPYYHSLIALITLGEAVLSEHKGAYDSLIT